LGFVSFPLISVAVIIIYLFIYYVCGNIASATSQVSSKKQIKLHFSVKVTEEHQRVKK